METYIPDGAESFGDDFCFGEEFFSFFLFHVEDKERVCFSKHTIKDKRGGD